MTLSDWLGDSRWDERTARVPELALPDPSNVSRVVRVVLPDWSLSRSERAQWARSWIDWLASDAAAGLLTSLSVEAGVDQDFLDVIGSLRGLRRLDVETGTYGDLVPLAGLQRLRAVILDCRRVRSVAPLLALQDLHSIELYGAAKVEDLERLGELDTLRDLAFSATPSSTLQVRPTSFSWMSRLRNLQSLHLAGAVISADLTPLAELPKLRHLTIPLRRRYRAQVEEFAASSVAFADLAQRYAEEDAHGWSVAMPPS
ncbi:hypothetical protein ABIB37_000897 [Agrococcus sp. UYP10]|uniref:hypothetical protein n=1 Tax=Agrococcus sp. UYP10 TaxID=1756355 RepID=UPI00339843DE